MPETTLGKLNRSAHLFYIDTTFGGATPEWYLVGKDVEDMSVELNPDVEIKKNILDETSASDKGYEPSISVDTYYANPSDGAIYTKLKDIMMNRLTGDACRTKVLEVLVDLPNDGTTAFSAWTENAIIKPQSYGGPQGGISIPFTVHFDGDRKSGHASMTNRVPTFIVSSNG